jgi:hypothetical protein
MRYFKVVISGKCAKRREYCTEKELRNKYEGSEKRVLDIIEITNTEYLEATKPRNKDIIDRALLK